MPEPAYEEENYDELGAELEQPVGLPELAPQVPGQAQPAATGQTDRQRLDQLYAAALKRQQELTALQQQEQQLGEQAITATQPQRDAAIAQAQRLGATADRIATTQTVPTLPEPPRMQNFLNRDVAGNMLAIATLIGGINSNGSIRSIRANQALAASVNGYMEGNLLVAKLGLEDWKNQVFKQAKEFEMIRQNNNDIMGAEGKSLEAKQAEVELAMKPFGMRMALLKDKHQFVRDMTQLDHNLFQIVDATIKTAAKVDPTIAALNLRIKDAQARKEEAQAKQAEAGQSGKAPTTEEYRLMLQRRAGGFQTGNRLVDELTPQMAQSELTRGAAAGGPKGPLSKTFMDEAKKRAEQLYKLGKTDPEIDAALRSEYGYKYLGRDPRANYGFSTDYKVAPVQAGDAPAAQAAPATPQALSGGRPANVPPNYVRVRLKANPNQFGWIDPVEFNPNIYERAQ